MQKLDGCQAGPGDSGAYCCKGEPPKKLEPRDPSTGNVSSLRTGIAFQKHANEPCATTGSVQRFCRTSEGFHEGSNMPQPDQSLRLLP
jgi:hypothetical protein